MKQSKKRKHAELEESSAAQQVHQAEQVQYVQQMQQPQQAVQQQQPFQWNVIGAQPHAATVDGMRPGTFIFQQPVPTMQQTFPAQALPPQLPAATQQNFPSSQVSLLFKRIDATA